jgi:hypothetical protein
VQIASPLLRLAEEVDLRLAQHGRSSDD